ncbi:MAG: hypothetical protein HY512_01100 [Candidatus Aenigmarchaeota archaeon]|nr:hypothetical protein [Candidatus Aenigmarchaeota archaeon]
MPIDTLTKSRVVHVTFLYGSGIPEEYRGKTHPVRCEGNNFYIGDDALEGSLRDYAAERIRQIDGAEAERAKRRDRPLKDLIASEGGPGAWGLPTESL